MRIKCGEIEFWYTPSTRMEVFSRILTLKGETKVEWKSDLFKKNTDWKRSVASSCYTERFGELGDLPFKLFNGSSYDKLMKICKPIKVKID